MSPIPTLVLSLVLLKLSITHMAAGDMCTHVSVLGTGFMSPGGWYWG